MNWQPSASIKQLHASSLGVGGRVLETEKSATGAGHAPYVLADADAWVGTLGPVPAAVYSVARRSKSAVVVTVLPLMVTIPNWPWAEAAGKYENAIPPDQTGDISEEKIACVSVHRRGPPSIQPNSLK